MRETRNAHLLYARRGVGLMVRAHTPQPVPVHPERAIQQSQNPARCRLKYQGIGSKLVHIRPSMLVAGLKSLNIVGGQL